MTAADAPPLLRRLVGFGRVLREAGAEIGPGRIQDALLALQVVDLGSRDEVYWALRCTLVSQEKDVDSFDAAFAAFWERAELAPADAEPDGLPGPDPALDPDRGGTEFAAAQRDREVVAAGEGEPDEGGEEGGVPSGTTWSAAEQLRELDFAEYSVSELRRSRQVVERLARATPMRRSRRLEAAHDGRELDKRRTLRAAMRTEGYPLERHTRRNRLVPRKLVFLVDVSGSMEPYARAMIMFLQAAVRGGRSVKAFTFGTRLTDITRELAGQDPDRALRGAARAVPDWAGGTRIGDNLRAFNNRYGPRGVTRGAVVVIASDGWERGDARLLAAEMERLRRAAHSVVWVNPLAGDADYEPLAEGMAAALPHVTHFLPGQNLRSLEGLAEVLERLPAGRGDYERR
ncbi:MAG TPA: VWA domain-containing protein [Thermoleophilaceae bacterium]|nr:VWA domain-containing protein [Thermoleophilaceae bacterium]